LGSEDEIVIIGYVSCPGSVNRDRPKRAVMEAGAAEAGLVTRQRVFWRYFDV